MLKQAAHRGGGVTVPEGVQEMFSGEILVIGGWLDWMILEGFSNLGDSMIFSDSLEILYEIKRKKGLHEEC